MKIFYFCAKEIKNERRCGWIKLEKTSVKIITSEVGSTNDWKIASSFIVVVD